MKFNNQPPPLQVNSISLWEKFILFLQMKDKKEHSREDVMLGRYIELSDRLIGLMRQRDNFGKTKYGTSLKLGNGRDFIQDAFEEALDLCIYTFGAYIEARDKDVVDEGKAYLLRVALNNATLCLALIETLLDGGEDEDGESIS